MYILLTLLGVGWLVRRLVVLVSLSPTQMLDPTFSWCTYVFLTVKMKHKANHHWLQSLWSVNMVWVLFILEVTYTSSTLNILFGFKQVEYTWLEISRSLIPIAIVNAFISNNVVSMLVFGNIIYNCGYDFPESSYVVWLNILCCFNWLCKSCNIIMPITIWNVLPLSAS